MSNNTVKASETPALPFFARFLEEQAEQPDNSPYQTKKYPSDWEDYQDLRNWHRRSLKYSAVVL